MSHEIKIFKETGSGQVTQWPEPNPEESLLAMASQESTRGVHPASQGCLVTRGNVFFFKPAPAPGTPAPPLTVSGLQETTNTWRGAGSGLLTPAAHSHSGPRAHV